jgi:predicted Zn-dependent protease
MSSAIEEFEAMVGREPSNAIARYMLANEYWKAGLHEKVVEQTRVYLQLKDDEGAAYRMLGQALEQLNRHEEARQAFEQGVEQALKHGHPGMADEFRQYVEELRS